MLPVVTEVLFNKEYTPPIAQERASATFDQYKDSEPNGISSDWLRRIYISLRRWFTSSSIRLN